MMDGKSARLVIFDVDGVLITGGNDGYFRCFHHAISGVGVDSDLGVERDFLLKTWGMPGPNQIEIFLSEKPELIEKSIQLYKDYLQSPDFLQYLKPIDGFPDVIHDLRNNNFKLAIATGMEVNMLKRLLTDYGVIACFDKIVSAYEITDPTLQKPAPYMVLRIMDELSESPEQTVYIGDAQNDYQMATAAQVNFVAVLTGHLSLEQTSKLNIKHVIPSVRDLPGILLA